MWGRGLGHREMVAAPKRLGQVCFGAALQAEPPAGIPSGEGVLRLQPSAPGVAVPPQSLCPDRGSTPPATARLVPLEGAMQEILFVVEEAEDGSYRASAAGAAIHTEADTLEELHREIRDAVVCHFDPGQAPSLIRLHHVRQELLAL